MFVLQVMLDVAGLYLTTEDLDACQHQLMTLLKNDKENDAATIVSSQLNCYPSHHCKNMLMHITKTSPCNTLIFPKL